GEVEAGAGDRSREPMGQLVDEGSLGASRAPGIVGVQIHEELIAVGPEGIRAGIVAAGLRGDGLDLWRLADEPANLARALRRLLEGDARGEGRPDPDDAFVALGQELRAERRAREAGAQDHGGA